jgi:hypothetical protein
MASRIQVGDMSAVEIVTLDGERGKVIIKKHPEDGSAPPMYRLLKLDTRGSE